jgi:hypothetical protein
MVTHGKPLGIFRPRRRMRLLDLTLGSNMTTRVGPPNWMLPHMCTNLLRYGDIIFLDAIMKEYNELCWPYIGPTVKDGEMKIHQVAECIAIDEKLDIYQFVI